MSHRIEQIVALERGDVELEIYAGYEDAWHGLIIWEIQGATLLSTQRDLDPDEIYNEIVDQGKFDALDQAIEDSLKSMQEPS